MRRIFALGPLLAVGACVAGSVLPVVRPLVSPNGVRITTDQERMEEVDGWYRLHVQTIQQDPSFWVTDNVAQEIDYPWENFTINEDTVRVWIPQRVPDAHWPFRVYGFYELMDEVGRIDDFVPEADGEDEFGVQRAFTSRLADIWLYARTVFATSPFEPLDRLVFSKENGYLDAFMFDVRGEEFPEERDAWIAANPGRLEEYRSWIQGAFGRPTPE